MLRRGYTFEQVGRVSRLALPVHQSVLATRLVTASAGFGTECVTHLWVGRTPERWRADMARLLTALSDGNSVGRLGRTRGRMDNRTARRRGGS